MSRPSHKQFCGRTRREFLWQAGGGFTDAPGTISNAYISQWQLGEMVARHLMEDIGGKGKIVAMLPIAGTTAAVDQLDALETVLKEYPDVCIHCARRTPFTTRSPQAMPSAERKASGTANDQPEAKRRLPMSAQGMKLAISVVSGGCTSPPSFPPIELFRQS